MTPEALDTSGRLEHSSKAPAFSQTLVVTPGAQSEYTPEEAASLGRVYAIILEALDRKEIKAS